MTTRVLIALLAGLGLGLFGSSTGNPVLVTAARWIEPLGTLFINAIRMTVIPLVVGSLIAGIAATPNPSALGKVGVRAFLLFLVTLFAGAIFAALVAPPAEIHLSSKFVRAVGPLQQFNVEAMANGQTVARGQITLHRTAAPPASATGGGAA